MTSLYQPVAFLVAAGCLVLLIKSFVGDFRPASKAAPEVREAIATQKAIKQVFENSSSGAPISIESIKEAEQEFGVKIMPHPLPAEFPSKQPAEQAEVFAARLLIERIEALEKRIEHIEPEPLGLWFYMKGILIWLVATFMTHPVTAISKAVFNFESSRRSRSK